jgi:GNAT superfamily N-acetyltransferase
VQGDAGEIEIARATRSDVDDIATLFDAYRRFYGQRSDVEGARTFLRARLDASESVIFVARDASRRALGFTQLYPSFSSVSMRLLWILNDLFVAEEARRLGVARRLLERARTFAHETGAKGLTLATGVQNRSARALYESCGWRLDEDFVHYDLTL